MTEYATQEAGRTLSTALNAIEQHGPLSQQATDAMRAGAMAEITARQQGATGADIINAAALYRPAPVHDGDAQD